MVILGLLFLLTLATWSQGLTDPQGVQEPDVYAVSLGGAQVGIYGKHRRLGGSMFEDRHHREVYGRVLEVEGRHHPGDGHDHGVEGRHLPDDGHVPEDEVESRHHHHHHKHKGRKKTPKVKKSKLHPGHPKKRHYPPPPPPPPYYLPKEHHKYPPPLPQYPPKGHYKYPPPVPQYPPKGHHKYPPPVPQYPPKGYHYVPHPPYHPHYGYPQPPMHYRHRGGIDSHPFNPHASVSSAGSLADSLHHKTEAGSYSYEGVYNPLAIKPVVFGPIPG